MERSGLFRPIAGAQMPLSMSIRISWGILALILTGLLITAAPLRFAELSSACLELPCEAARLSTEGHAVLNQSGISSIAYAAYSLSTEVFVALVYLAASALIMWRPSENRFAVFAALMLPLFGIGVSESIYAIEPGSPALIIALRLLNSLGFVSFFVACYLFPDGQFFPRWTRYLAAVWMVLEIPWAFPDLIEIPVWLDIPLTLGLIASCLLAQVLRYKYRSEPAQRQQTKWVLFGLFVAITGFAAYGVPPLIFPAVVEPGLREVLFYLAGRTLVGLSLIALPVTIGIAIWRYRLWDIDLIVNRTFIYAILTGLMIATYALIAGSLGALFQARGNWLISLVAAGGVAVLFQPLRIRIQQTVNRMMFGERDDPAAVLTGLARTLEAAVLPDEVLTKIIDTIRQTLRLPYASIQLVDDGEASRTGAFGIGRQDTYKFPMFYQGEILAYLVAAPRERGEALSSADQSLLESIARQAGPAIYAMKLTADLQRSRERLVLGREDERRRIRRDLHDGLGPMLASQSLLLDTISRLIHHDLDMAEQVISEIKLQTQSALSDVRQLIYNLRPPSLDDLGLAGALQEEIDRHRAGSLQISIHSDSLPPLPAAVEVAIFRIVQEAVTNVVRHAAAKNCDVHLEVRDEDGRTRLAAEIKDDGIGIRSDHPVGVGLESMRERAAELGGECRIETAGARGTLVQVWLPLDKEG
jgi:signal transduction histidine kinase